MKQNHFLFLALFFSLNFYSQIEFKTNLGMKFGLNRSTINGFEPNGTKTGFTGTEVYGGFFASTKVGKNTYLGNELLYSFTDEYHFIEVPINLKHRITKNLYIFYGVKFDFMAANRQAYNFEPTAYSAEIGLQYFVTKKVFFEARYSLGLTPQVNDLQLDIYKGKRNTFRLGAGVIF